MQFVIKGIELNYVLYVWAFASLLHLILTHINGVPLNSAWKLLHCLILWRKSFCQFCVLRKWLRYNEMLLNMFLNNVCFWLLVEVVYHLLCVGLPLPIFAFCVPDLWTDNLQTWPCIMFHFTFYEIVFLLLSDFRYLHAKQLTARQR